MGWKGVFNGELIRRVLLAGGAAGDAEQGAARSAYG